MRNCVKCFNIMFHTERINIYNRTRLADNNSQEIVIEINRLSYIYISVLFVLDFCTSQFYFKKSDLLFNILTKINF